MRTEDDEARPASVGGVEDAGMDVVHHDHRLGLDPVRAGKRVGGLGEERERFPSFAGNQPFASVAVDDVDEDEAGLRPSGDQDRSPKGAVGPGREIGRHQDPLHSVSFRYRHREKSCIWLRIVRAGPSPDPRRSDLPSSGFVLHP